MPKVRTDKEDAQNEKIETKGMVYDRSCTDIICCLVFVVFVVGMVGVSGYAISNGDPLKILTAFDSDGNRCGANNQAASGDGIGLGERDFTEYPYKFYTDLDNALFGIGDKAVYTLSVCVKTCPEFPVESPPSTLPLNNMATKVYPKDYVIDQFASFDPEEAVRAKTKIELSNTEIIGGQCIIAAALNETMYEEIIDMIYDQVNEGFGSYIRAISDSWPVLAIMGGVTLIITLIYIYLLRCITKPILYGSLLLIFLFLIGVTYYSFVIWSEVEDKESDDYKATMALFVVCALLLVIYCVCICCMWKAIALGAAIMETASDFIGANKKVVFLPFFAYLVAFPIIIWWTVSAVYIYGLGVAEFKPEAFVASVTASNQSEYLFLYEMFGMFWLVAWIIAIQIFIVGAVACMWYFSGQGSDAADGESDHPVGVCIAIKWAFRYHLGSLAMGAFLVAVITMIRVIFEYIVYQYEKTEMKDNIVFKCVTCYVRCILKCLDACIKFINKNAYIQVALHNRAFCTAAKESFFLMARNAARFNAVQWTGAILLFIGKLLICTSCAFLTVVLVKAQYPLNEQPLVPAIIVGIFAYMIASVFLAVFDFSALTILHCFSLDEEQGGSRNTPDGLRKFLDMDPETQIKSKEAN